MNLFFRTQFLKTYLIQIIILLLVVMVIIWYLYESYLQTLDRKDNNPGFSVINPPGEVSAMVIDGHYIWAGGQAGLYKIDKKSGKVVGFPDEFGDMKYVRAILKDSKGLLWIGHEQGISVLAENKRVEITTKNGLCDNRIYSILQDSKGNIWIGTWNGVSVIKALKDKSLFRQTGYNIKTYKKEDGLLSNMANFLFEDSKSGIWIGSYIDMDGGISYLENGKNWLYFNEKNGLLHNYITAIMEDTDGYIWIGTGLLDQGGATRFYYSSNRWKVQKKYLKKDGLAGEKVRSLFEDKDRNIWLGSEYDGVSIISKNKIKVLSKNEGLSDNEVKVICQDNKGKIWMGTRNGITGLEYKALSEFLKE